MTLTQKDLTKLLKIIAEKCQPVIGVSNSWPNGLGSVQEIWQNEIARKILVEQAAERLRQNTAPGSVNNLAGKYLGEIRAGMISKDPAVIASELDRILRNPNRTPVDNAFLQIHERDPSVRSELIRREVGIWNPKTQKCD